MTSVEWRNWLIAAGENRGWQVPAKYGRQKEFSKFKILQDGWYKCAGILSR